MKTASRHIFTLLALCVVFGLAVPAQAQNREKYIISAQAGGINLVSGNVKVLRPGGRWQEELTSSDDLQTGDTVTTGAGGRVEILLNPGSYMRVDENSEFELTDASLDSLLVKLIKGSVVVEVTGPDGVDLAIGIKTPQADASIIRGGIYRFNILPNETTEIIVRKGRVLFANGAEMVKGGRKVLIRHGLWEVAKLNKKDQDSLDLWSKERAELLAKANRRLERRPLLVAFNDFGWNDFNGWGRSARYGSLGLWVYNARVRSYCFVPFGYSGWSSSPYGHSYGTGIGYNPSGTNWGPGTGQNGNPSSGGSGGGNGSGSGGGNGNGNGGGTGNVNPPAPAPQPPPAPSYHPPPSRPMVEAPDRGPRKVFTDGSPQG